MHIIWRVLTFRPRSWINATKNLLILCKLTLLPLYGINVCSGIFAFLFWSGNIALGSWLLPLRHTLQWKRTDNSTTHKIQLKPLNSWNINTNNYIFKNALPHDGIIWHLEQRTGEGVYQTSVIFHFHNLNQER